MSFFAPPCCWGWLAGVLVLLLHMAFALCCLASSAIDIFCLPAPVALPLDEAQRSSKLNEDDDAAAALAGCCCCGDRAPEVAEAVELVRVGWTGDSTPLPPAKPGDVTVEPDEAG